MDSPALPGGLEPDSAWLFFGLATLTGGTLRAAESTMWAERPRVPGCICVRIFLSSEISLVSLQGKREYLVPLEMSVLFCSLMSMAFKQES